MQPSFELVVCIASIALFDCRESHEIWAREGCESYKKHQHEHVNVPLKPGVGFPLVQSLLELNKVVDKPLVDVVLVSRNDTESEKVSDNPSIIIIFLLHTCHSPPVLMSPNTFQLGSVTFFLPQKKNR